MQAEQTQGNSSQLQKGSLKDPSNFKESLSPQIKNRISTRNEDLRALYRKKKLPDRKKVKIRSIQEILMSPQKFSQSIFKMNTVIAKQEITKSNSIHLPKIVSHCVSRSEFLPIKIFQEKDLNQRSHKSMVYTDTQHKFSQLDSSPCHIKHEQKFDKASLIQKFRERLKQQIKEFNFAQIQDHCPDRHQVKTKFKKFLIQETSTFAQKQNDNRTQIPNFLMKWIDGRSYQHA